MEIYIVVPSMSLSGPVKGAFAIANLLTNKHIVNIVFLKTKEEENINLYDNPEIRYIFLGKYQNFFTKLLRFRELFKNKKKEKTIIFSLCFSADFYTILAKKGIHKISSIRGNLYRNYFYSYSLFGLLLAFIHLYIQRFFNLTLVMNNSIRIQVRQISNTNILIIRNFIDEFKLEKYIKKEINKEKTPSFIFVGDLTKRKDPLSVLEAFREIKKNKDCILHIVGDGPLRKSLEKNIKKYNLERYVFMHGFLSKPYELISNCDVFVLPSYSEGTPRAAMEALFLGVPCVLRNVDCNSDLVNRSIMNCNLFQSNEELPVIMLKTLKESRSRLKKFKLLPDEFRLNSIIDKYESVFDIN